MKRTVAEALVLVNWRGVFYSSYLFDRHVTALEGSNGAGKTTVMIAAYVVLLPDMSRLRFTNLGESGATGGDKGIWGRLGESGRPSYAAIEFTLGGGERLLAGVHLMRKGEPSVDPTPFVVTGLAADVRLQELMLIKQGDNEEVPEIGELRENVARLGGKLATFTSARDYFAALFEQGVTPLRLNNEEDRKKFNDMLRTSMTGGISRALTSELRSFLLKEEVRLASNLQQMRANLDACRRTRGEVQESQRLEREIGQVYEAGHTMFAAAVLSARARADELRDRVLAAEAILETAQQAFADADAALARTTTELSTIDEKRDGLDQELQSARSWHARMRDALSAKADLVRREAALDSAKAEAMAASDARAAADETRRLRREELERAESDYNRAAEGVANFQKGIDELHRRASAYLQVVQRCHSAQTLLGIDALAIAELGQHLLHARAELAAADGERRTANTRLDDGDAHRERHDKVMAALRALVDHPVETDAAHDCAQTALGKHRDQIALSKQVEALSRDLGAARKSAERQIRVRALADDLGVVQTNEPARTTVDTLLGQAEDERDAGMNQERASKADIAAAERDRQDFVRRRQVLAEREPEWREHTARAKALGAYLGSPVEDRLSLDLARERLGSDLEALRTLETATRLRHEGLLRDAHDLESTGGRFSRELLAVRDELGADLVAGLFEDAQLDEAAIIEAKLGPLAQALVVDDTRAAARLIADRPETLPDVLLVARDADLNDLTSARVSDLEDTRDVVVDEGAAVRVTRIPTHPRLGRRAREAQAAALRNEAATVGLELDACISKRRQLERLYADADALFSGHVVWLSGDPAVELEEIRQHMAEAEARISTARRSLEEYAVALKVIVPRIKMLRDLLADANLLDPPDFGARTLELEAQHRAAVAAQADVTRQAGFVAIVESGLADLRTPPLSPAARESLRVRVAELQQLRDRLRDGIEALVYVQGNANALEWSEAPKRLSDEEALVPALTEQLAETKATRAMAEAAKRQAEDCYDAATSSFQDADNRRGSAVERHLLAQERFIVLQIPVPTKEDLQTALLDVERLDRELRVLTLRREELLTAKGREATVLQQAQEKEMAADEKLRRERCEADPAHNRWERVRERAMAHGLLAGVLAPNQAGIQSGGGHIIFVQIAETQRRVLDERIRTAQGGSELSTRLDEIVGQTDTDSDFANKYFDTWLTVRHWLLRRLPAQFAEVDDPREALQRLHDQLETLQARLARQEEDLRGVSEDVALGISVEIRKARGQVARLNRHLEGVSFGSIGGIHVKLRSDEKMEKVLQALRDGSAQQLLFNDSMPIEQALDAIFQRYGGGRTGGHRLLDYREYVHLQVEIKRRSSASWEEANPTRLSTGEAIGVGAALMMVVLTEWERDANMLRGKRAFGSLRFLFLDEANRLSHDNLGVLFDLCQTLDLQLLIAAPEVARAEGNTTYRLVRRSTADGREEVLVQGRRTRVQP